MGAKLAKAIEGFQPTRPLRGATVDSAIAAVSAGNFNPRAPCGARRLLKLLSTIYLLFQPTRPLRGATELKPRKEHRVIISTHAPLAGRDDMVEKSLELSDAISTHAPLAGRDAVRGGSRGLNEAIFQPTRPLRGATTSIWPRRRWLRRFQPTRPLRGATSRAARLGPWGCRDFNPRAPCGARRDGP